jgi:hypothetical protein
MPDSFLHERRDFKALVETVAESEKINDPALVEKDYWIFRRFNHLEAGGCLARQIFNPMANPMDHGVDSEAGFIRSSCSRYTR